MRVFIAIGLLVLAAAGECRAGIAAGGSTTAGAVVTSTASARSIAATTSVTSRAPTTAIPVSAPAVSSVVGTKAVTPVATATATSTATAATAVQSSALDQMTDPVAAPPARERGALETDVDGTRVEELDEIRGARDASTVAPQPEPKPKKPRGDDDSGFFGSVASKAKGIGKRAADFIGDVGRGADKEVHHFVTRMSHNSVDLTESKTLTNLTIVVPGTDLGTRVIGFQIDKYGHYNPSWSHDPKFIAEIQGKWEASQVKLFTWLSGPDRLTINSAANGLYHFIVNWRKGHPKGKVQVYAHSNGGNVSLHAAARYKQTSSTDYFIDELVTVGTPIRPDDEMTTRFKAIGKLYFVFSRNDWVAGDVHGPDSNIGDPRRGVVPKILQSGHTPELAIYSKLFRSAGPIQSPTSQAFVLSLDQTSATTRSVEDVIMETYGHDFFARRDARTIGEIDASQFVAGHSDYYRSEINVQVLQQVERYERGEVPDAGLAPAVEDALPH